MQKKEYEVTALFFKLPFSKDAEKEVREFVEENKVKLKVFDCTKGKLLQEYLEVIKNAKFGRGAGINPCVDCKIFMLKKAKEFADDKGIDLIATGEVEGQRPMSQTKGKMEFIEEESGLKGKIIRPLSEFGAFGRRREKQIQLAKKFNLEYPHPAGGCILCERELRKRLSYLLERGLNTDEIKLVNVGRHFLIEDCWVVLGRDEVENKIIEDVGRKIGILIVPDYIGPSALILDKCDKRLLEIVKDLIKAYSKKGSCAPLGVSQGGTRPQTAECRGKEREKFEGWKL